MHQVKASINTGSSSVRQTTISSTHKNPKVEALNQIVNNMGYPKTQAISTEMEAGGSSIPEHRGAMGEHVLAVLKHKIKTNYDQLYSNYPENRSKIFKQIQTVETNINGENAMNTKYQEIFKEKGKYDKLKATVEDKQRKLKKLLDIRNQLQQDSQTETMEQTKQLRQKIEKIQSKKEQLQHNNLIYNQMFKERKLILLTLDKRQKQMSCSVNEKKEKAQKTAAITIRRRQQLLKLEQEVSKQQNVELPPALAEQLANKLEQIENKHSYNNIIRHQAILEQQRFQELKEQAAVKREQHRIARMNKDKKEKEQLISLQNECMINNIQKQKIQSLYGVEDIEEAIHWDSQAQTQRLQHMKEDIEKEIKQIEEDNTKLQQELENIVSKENGYNFANGVSTQLLLQKCQKKELQNKLLASELEKKKDMANHWQTIMHLINNNQQSQVSLNELISGTKDGHSNSIPGIVHRKSKRSKGGNSQQSESIDFQ